MSITVVAQIPGLTAEEDAALVGALDLEGSPPAGGKVRLDGPAGGGQRIVGLWDRDAAYERSVTTGSCPRSGSSAAHCR